MTLLMTVFPPDAGVNIALGKTAVQSSRNGWSLGNPRSAVDGNTASDYRLRSCTHTAGEANPIFVKDSEQDFFARGIKEAIYIRALQPSLNRDGGATDFLQPMIHCSRSHMVLSAVLIFNRMDCCPERLNPFNIHIGDSDQVSDNPKCGGDHQIDVKRPSISVSCQGMKGRYVGVRLPGFRVLTLCEVQVFPEQACKEEGATLAMPKTKELDHALRNLVKTSGGNSGHWIGMRVICTGIWFDSYEIKWVDGSPLGQYKGWHSGKPADIKYLKKGDSLCVQYWTSGSTTNPMWDDADCTEKRRYICQSSPA
ncbi:hypothetical protein Bbelb_084920 [Branchiostoma belcheri]|nr:hypothetical protein Bbelb_084920 [Branchiostoma belcheri]